MAAKLTLDMLKTQVAPSRSLWSVRGKGGIEKGDGGVNVPTLSDSSSSSRSSSSSILVGTGASQSVPSRANPTTMSTLPAASAHSTYAAASVWQEMIEVEDM
eukprot:evm.model.NODE_12404_length_7192_cov_16.675472.1